MRLFPSVIMNLTWINKITTFRFVLPLIVIKSIKSQEYFSISGTFFQMSWISSLGVMNDLWSLILVLSQRSFFPKHFDVFFYPSRLLSSMFFLDLENVLVNTVFCVFLLNFLVWDGYQSSDRGFHILSSNNFLNFDQRFVIHLIFPVYL